MRTATLEQPEHGLGGDVLAETDVLTWWGHIAHDDVSDDVVARVHEAVLGGMGLLVLHSAHYSKIFKRLLGTPCDLRWRNDGERELVWTVAPSHPIAAGVPNPIEIEAQEMYGEPFAIPAPEELIFISASPAARSSAAAARGRAGRAGSSTSAPATRTIPSTTTRTSSGCWPTACSGRRRGCARPSSAAREAPVGWWR